MRLGTLCTASLALALLAAPGCRERGHSQAFDEASALFRKVYAEKLDSAYEDPRMQEVERLLAAVPPQSIDSVPAQELQQRITAGRASLGTGRESPQQDGPKQDPWANWKPPPTPRPPPVPDAGPPDAGAPHPYAGMEVEELRKRFSDCFSFKQNIRIQDQTRHDLWAVADTVACGKAHPGFDEEYLVLDEDGKKVMGFVPVTALVTRYYYPDGGEAPPPQQQPRP